MRLHLWLVLVASGCAVQEPNLGEVDLAMKRGCSDPTCNDPNGGGVYTDENGFAGIGPNQFLITHFINNGNDVAFQGRYYFNDPTGPAYWRFGTGIVTGAQYQGHAWNVKEITESFTVPTFTLTRSGVPAIDVTGPDIAVGLVVQIHLYDDSGDYDLQWNSYGNHQGNNVVVRTAKMLWRSAKQSIPWTQYCRTAAGGVDPIVFQQGIGIHPVTADLLYNNAFVTPGCLHGGVATVRLWGYSYRANTTTADLFRAALHMKRASYCGDQSFYTISGTEIRIWDTAQVNSDTDPNTPIEASWGPNGATCVNVDWLRHGDVTFTYPGGSPEYFNGTCPNRVIPPCSPGPAGYGNLASTAEDPYPSP